MRWCRSVPRSLPVLWRMPAEPQMLATTMATLKLRLMQSGLRVLNAISIEGPRPSLLQHLLWDGLHSFRDGGSDRLGRLAISKRIGLESESVGRAVILPWALRRCPHPLISVQAPVHHDVGLFEIDAEHRVLEALDVLGRYSINGLRGTTEHRIVDVVLGIAILADHVGALAALGVDGKCVGRTRDAVVADHALRLVDEQTIGTFWSIRAPNASPAFALFRRIVLRRPTRHLFQSFPYASSTVPVQLLVVLRPRVVVAEGLVSCAHERSQLLRTTPENVGMDQLHDSTVSAMHIFVGNPRLWKSQQAIVVPWRRHAPFHGRVLVARTAPTQLSPPREPDCSKGEHRNEGHTLAEAGRPIRAR
mmetsp:Transcript_8611/g.22250  ORF Transcript_8611/g.22250 Transcript_8611/m.22250 type:complete len:362 (+) Transcript_8611:223-1308(+)